MSNSIYPLDSELMEKLFTDGLNGDVAAQMLFLSLGDPDHNKISAFLWQEAEEYLKKILDPKTIQCIKRKIVEC